MNDISTPLTDRMINQIALAVLLFAMSATALFIWNGNGTAIEIKNVVIEVCIIGILGLSLFKLILAKSWSITKDPVSWLVCLYAGSITVRYLLTDMNSLNFREFMPQVSACLIYGSVQCFVQKKHFNRIFLILTILVLIASCYGLLQFFHLDPLYWADKGRRMVAVSFFGHKNAFAVFLIMLLPFVGFGVVTSFSLVSRIFACATFFIGIFALSVSNSRGCLFGFLFLGICASLILAVRIQRDFKRSSIQHVLLAIVPLVTVAVFLFLPKSIRTDFVTLVTHKEYQDRLNIYNAALEVISNHPFSGVGPGNFTYSHVTNKNHKVMYSGPEPALSHAHNDLLDIWVENGIIALVLYILVLATLSVLWANQMRHVANRYDIFLLVIIAWSICDFVFYSMFDASTRFTSSIVYFWFFLGLANVVLLQDKRQLWVLENTFYKKRVPTIALFGVALALAFIFEKQVVANYLSDVDVQHAFSLSTSDLSKSMNYLNRAICLQPKSIEAYYQKGFVYFSAGYPDSAIKNYRLVQKYVPDYADVHFNLSSCYYAKKDWQSTINESEMAVNLYPKHVPSLLMLGYCNYYTFRPREALYYCNRVLQIDNKNSKAVKLREILESIIGQGGSK